MLAPVWDWIASKLSPSLSEYVKYIKLFVETVLSTLILLFVEFMFKAFFRARNNEMLSNGIISYIASFFFWLLSSTAALFVNIAEWTLKHLFDVKLNEKKEVFSKIDLEHFLQQSKGHEEEDNKEINKELFENALSLSEVKLRECLIPRREIEGVDSTTSIEAVKDKLATLYIVHNDDEMMMVTNRGIMIRQTTNAISIQSRSATGVRVQRLDDDDAITGVAIVPPDTGDVADLADTEVEAE